MLAHTHNVHDSPHNKPPSPTVNCAKTVILVTGEAKAVVKQSPTNVQSRL